MFGYLVCDFDADSDFYLKFTVKGANGVGVLRSRGQSPGGDELPLRGGAATVVIERAKGKISYRLGRKTVPTRRFGYYYDYGSSTRTGRGDDDRSRVDSRSLRSRADFVRAATFGRELQLGNVARRLPLLR